ncbi:MAG: outer membrane lipoprotein carrier protein LolA [Desulfobulbus sp.]
MQQAGRIVLLCLLLLPQAALAAPLSVRSVQAEFTQEKQMKILIRPLHSNGTFVFQAPGSLRWEYLQPLHSLLLMHGGRVGKWIEQDGVLTQESGAGLDAMQIVLQDIGNWLDGRFTENPQFTVVHTDARKVVLTPKAKGLRSVVERIELLLGEEAGVVEEVGIYESAETSTHLYFHHILLNQEIPLERFITP